MGLLDDASLADDREFQQKVTVAVLRHAQALMREPVPETPSGDLTPVEQQKAIAAQQRHQSRRFLIQRILDNAGHWGQAMARMIAADPEIADGATDQEIIDAVERHWEAFSA
jgi:hypothetical protein